LGLRTLICRQILETCATTNNDDDSNAMVLVPSLVKVMKEKNLSLMSCATAALVNLSFGKESTKNLLVEEGCMSLCMEQLKLKDDDLTLYTLYLLVNLTKTPHQRSIVVRHGGVLLLVDILTSCYQNHTKWKILAEMASVLGQLCNDAETRELLSEINSVCACLLYIYDAAPPNTKLKSKLLFALRQLSYIERNKLRIGAHAIPVIIEELGQASPKTKDGRECALNALLLLTLLASIHSNALLMRPLIELALEMCGLSSQTKSTKQWPDSMKTHVQALRDRIREAAIASGLEQ